MKTATFDNMIIIGRNPHEFAAGNSTFMVFRSSLVSRLHAVVGFDNFGTYIMDVGTNMKGSANGTFINGKRILPMTPYYIKESDSITLGHPWPFRGCDVQLGDLGATCAA